MSERQVAKPLEDAACNNRLAVGTYEELVSPAGLKIINAPDSSIMILPHFWRRRGPSLSAAAQALPEGATHEDLQDPDFRKTNNLTELFESSEHVIIAADAKLKYLDGTTAPAISHRIKLVNGLALTYGQILALSGDFYGDPNQPVSTLPTFAERQTKFFDNFQSLAAATQAKYEVGPILAVLNQEFQMVAQAIQEGQSPSAAYEAMGDTLSFRWNEITYSGSLPRPCEDPSTKICWFPRGRYLMLAGTNFDHFGNYALLCYEAGHQQALEMAISASTREQLDQAYAVNAFADHFLTDLFSAGHIRNPRKEMYDDASSVTPGFIPSFLSRIMHDEDSQYGLWVSNRRGDTWVAYGDKRYRDMVNYGNAKIVQSCVKQSMEDIYQAASTRTLPPPGQTPVFDYIPALPLDDQNRHNYAPLFSYRPDTSVTVRDDLTNKLDYQRTRVFTYPTLWADFGFQTAGPPLEPTPGDPGNLPPATGTETGLTGAPPFGTPTGATGPDVPAQPWRIISATGA